MLSLIKLWIVSYKLENGKMAKCKFFTFYNDSTKQKVYKIKNEAIGVEGVIGKIEGNNYFKGLLKYDKNAIINKVV